MVSFSLNINRSWRSAWFKYFVVTICVFLFAAPVFAQSISGNVGLEGVTLTFSDGGGSATSIAGGAYTHVVAAGWSGTVTPSIAGYTFTPAARDYTDVQTDLTNEDYTPLINTYTISGTIQDGGSTPIAGVVMSGLPGSPSTDGSGFYTASVDHGWSGTVTPTLAGYTFSPPNTVYSNVTSDQLNEDYTATLLTFTITGTITDGSNPLLGVTVNGLPGNPLTNALGVYTATVNYGFSGTATPSLSGYSFAPVSRPYTSVTASQTAQDYVGTLGSYTISGTIQDGGSAPIAGVVMSGLPGSPSTDGSGFYTASVDHGWSGTVTPTLAGYTFSPPNTVYSNVTSDQLNEDYTATLLTFTITGTITDGSNPLLGVTVNGLPGNPLTNALGVYTATVNYGFSGTATPSLSGYSFAPVSRPYTSVTASQTAQDYVGTLGSYTISGTIQDGGSAPIAGVVMSGLPGSPSTDGSGFYTASVDHGWSGTVTPTLAGYTFAPPNTVYSNVTRISSTRITRRRF